MNLRVLFRRPAPVARRVCPHCENRRALFRQEGIRKWDPYYALCYRCYQRYVTRVQGQQGSPAEAAIPADRPDRRLAPEISLQPAP